MRPYTIIVHRPWLYALTIQPTGVLLGLSLGILAQCMLWLHPMVFTFLMLAAIIWTVIVRSLARPLGIFDIKVDTVTRAGSLHGPRGGTGLSLAQIEQVVANSQLPPAARSEITSLLAARLHEGRA